MSFRREQEEVIPDVETSVWACTNEDCNGWMREAFSFQADPACPFCQSEMAKENRILPKIE